MYPRHNFVYMCVEFFLVVCVGVRTVVIRFLVHYRKRRGGRCCVLLYGGTLDTFWDVW